MTWINTIRDIIFILQLIKKISDRRIHRWNATLTVPPRGNSTTVVFLVNPIYFLCERIADQILEVFLFPEIVMRSCDLRRTPLRSGRPETIITGS
jgi:hypothetical protein